MFFEGNNVGWVERSFVMPTLFLNIACSLDRGTKSHINSPLKVIMII